MWKKVRILAALAVAAAACTGTPTAPSSTPDGFRVAE